MSSAEQEIAPRQIGEFELGKVLDTLKADGYKLVGPTVRDEAIVYDEIDTIADLPKGWTDEQKPGHYRLKRGRPNRYFDHVVGPQSWKKFLFPPRVRLWQAQRQGTSFTVKEDEAPAQGLAFIGVRACEIQAIRLQDKVFHNGANGDPRYGAVRDAAFVLAVQCVRAGDLCFCASMGTGPNVKSGYDMALTEITQDGEPRFVVSAGSERGEAVLARLDAQAASDADQAEAAAAVERSSRSMGRSVDTVGLKALMADNFENPIWSSVAERCLSCANCTMVCPTCFCSTVEDTTDLSGEIAERWQRWDSCFTMDFSYVAGGNIRRSTKSRYRQWITHKFSFWHDQFGASGCVGCGRCIAWCPVGIDITEEIGALRQSAANKPNPEEV